MSWSIARIKWFGPRRQAAVGIAAVAALVAGGIYLLTASGPRQTTLFADFSTSPGLFPGNHVDVLGMAVGTVVKVTPHPTNVTVELRVPASVPIPAGATAEIMAPDVVNDRYVQLDPPYSGGPRLADRATIPTNRTEVPVSVDGVIDSLDQLAVALGPKGANANGSLSDLVASAAKAFGGNGSALNSTLNNLGNAFGALSQKSPQLTQLLDSLGNLSHVASQYTVQYQAFANDLAVVSTDLSADDSNLGSALSNLQQALGALATFIQDNSGSLGASVSNLSTFAGAVAQKQAQLEQVLGVLPVALQNLDNAFDPTTHALRARFDPQTGSDPLAQAECGNSLLRLLLVVLDLPQDKIPTDDLACGVSGLLTSLPPIPGESSGPNLSLSALAPPALKSAGSNSG